MAHTALLQENFRLLYIAADYNSIYLPSDCWYLIQCTSAIYVPRFSENLFFAYVVTDLLIRSICWSPQIGRPICIWSLSLRVFGVADQESDISFSTWCMCALLILTLPRNFHFFPHAVLVCKTNLLSARGTISFLHR